MAIFNSYVSLPEGNMCLTPQHHTPFLWYLDIPSDSPGVWIYHLVIWRFPQIGAPQFPSIDRWISHEINHAAIRAPPWLWKPSKVPSNPIKSPLNPLWNPIKSTKSTIHPWLRSQGAHLMMVLWLPCGTERPQGGSRCFRLGGETNGV